MRVESVCTGKIKTGYTCCQRLPRHRDSSDFQCSSHVAESSLKNSILSAVAVSDCRDSSDFQCSSHLVESSLKNSILSAVAVNLLRVSFCDFKFWADFIPVNTLWRAQAV
jgi:hypothetical protein